MYNQNTNYKKFPLLALNFDFLIELQFQTFQHLFIITEPNPAI